MADNRSRQRAGRGRRAEGTPQSQPPGDPEEELSLALAEIATVLDTPLAELMGSEEERAAVEALGVQAAATPTMSQLTAMVAFVGKGRPVTPAGNLKPADARALAGRLGRDEDIEAARNLNELPDTAAIFRWAVAAGLLERRGVKVVGGPLAADLGRDPFSVWLTVAATLLEHGLLGGFHTGWRKSYVDLLDESAPGLLGALAEVDTVSLVAVENEGWQIVAEGCGYEPDDAAERDHVVGLVRGMVAQLVELGVVEVSGDEVSLTALGGPLAAGVLLSAEGGLDGFDDLDDVDDLDLVDFDAASLLLACSEDMDHDEARGHLLVWCGARTAGQAVNELCEALLDDDDPEVWALGLEALAMVDRAVAEPAVRRLRSDPGMGPLVAAWLGRPGVGSDRKKKR